MTINEAQEQVDQWINTTGERYFNELTNMAILRVYYETRYLESTK